MRTPADERLEVMIGERDIQERVAQLGRRITLDYEGKDLVLVAILKGSFVFVADLARAIDLPVAVDFMAVSSYGMSTKSSGVVRIVKDLDYSLDQKHVLVVEDIVDTGLTLNYIFGHLKSRGAMSVKICSLLDKVGRRQVAVPVHYKGFEIPDEFVVGYGLDVEERYRNLKDVCRVVKI
ncbi:hypoxanthine phosphoribosyltransferase [Sulfobacillus sp. DSM 109850]|uniref:Hypoxanthine phosphoribosyltransferase n=2 Tax=Sulfobacillus harzensis TaxID=2729629 RepID=A0A7Y0L6H1_9FIRM|nr:hypoxanthine phosphoribosyltransferase [Sulfobacillus harzensis]